MANLLSSLQRKFTTPSPLKAGTYHYQAPPNDPRNYRLHLRLEPDGNGILIVNASTVLHLNQTAAEYAYHLVHNHSPEEAARQVSHRYRVDQKQALNDYQDIVDRIQALINTPDLDPVTFLDFDRQIPFTGHIGSPYRLDCALTYRLPAGISPDYAPSDRVKEELSTGDWKKILDKAWAAGIPHIIFTGGEPTLRDDLVELISHAENNNQVTGLLTDGLRLSNMDYVNDLLQSGLDHLLILVNPEFDRAWLALDNVLPQDLFVAVHVTITQKNADQVPDLIEKLAEHGVREISISASDKGLSNALESAREQIAMLDLDLVWNLPVPYSAHNPIMLEVETLIQTEGAGHAWLYVEPDGDVLPQQGINKVIGNLLHDPWEKIWSHEK